jgi:N-acetyl sugar amidotransferase
MTEVFRCRTCLYTNKKPDLHFDSEGICSACRNYANRPEIDWDTRKKELVNILSDSKPNGSGYDCIVPSSGGKDSHYQALTLIELGARPLIVTATTDFLTPLGRANIDNLSRYATTIEVTPNRSVRAKLCRLGLELVGDPCWPEHVLIHRVPFRVARDLGISLIFYGECGPVQYGGPKGTENTRQMTQRFVSEFGGFLGLRAEDFIGQEGITEQDMRDYVAPDSAELVSANIAAHFLGWYQPWDSHRNAAVAKAHGMRQELPSPANYWCHENLDNIFTSAHDFLMWRKYHYGRATAQLSVDIRAGLITREEALPIAEQRDGIMPDMYAGGDVWEAMEMIGVSKARFFEIADQFTNWSLHTRC